MEEEMDSIESDHNDDCIIGDSSPGSPDMDDIFGDPQILPRVGDQYQVSVPSLVTTSDGVHIIQSSTNVEVTVDTADSFLMGLPIPIMWIYDQPEKTMLKGKSNKHEGQECRRDSDDEADTNETAESENNKVSPINADNISSKVKVEALDVDCEKTSRKSPNGEAVAGNQMEVDLPLEQHEKYNMYQKSNGKRFYPAPGLSGNSWSNIELESFLLGLYIFGKNLVQVKRFTESKEMRDILSYYYGKFYMSDGHRRWSECRKIRSRKCIHGQRIFTGWRQQELLSRLRPHVLEEGQNSLLEVSKAFGEGKITLEDYVFSLKATVGTQTLIEAVGIGKGKQDLTGIMDPIKTNQVNPSRQEIPSGKDCNSLTSEDIVKFLTGDFRLSKARSNDLFWEAVWPRLLARGWRSEQPKSQRYAGAKNSLVFLIPGVKKFSRRRLTKGNQYFDSVADVLNKVASDPKLLDVEVETPRGSGSKEKHGCDTERKLELNGPSDHQRHCYLKPRVSNCTPEIMKFTVVDTSLIHEEGPFKIRELRNLPVGANTRTRISREAAVASSEEPMDKPDILLNHQEDTNGSSRPTKDILDRFMFTESLDCPVSVLKNCMPINGQGNTNSLIENHEGQSMDVCGDQNVQKTLKYQSRPRAKRGQSNGLAPVMKRRRLTACGRAEARRITNKIPADSRVKEEPCSPVESPDISDNLDSAVGPSQEKVSTSSSEKASPDESSEDIHADSCVGREPCHVKAEPRTLIDLNLPHVPLDFEVGTEVVDSPDDQSAKGSSYPSETILPDDSQSLRTSNEIASEEEQPTVNARRQSTRNRPLTTKALEALACGYLNTKRKWRGAEPMTRENSLARPSRRVRRRVGVPTSLSDVPSKIKDSKVDEGVEEVCSSSTSMQTKSLVPTERTRIHELKPIYHSEILAGKNNRPR